MRSAFLVLTLVVAAGCHTYESGPHPTRRTGFTSRYLEYTVDGTVHRGLLALPTDTSRPHPAVLVVHDWWGRGLHADKSAEKLAELGYVGFALDMYGGAQSTTDPAQAGKWSAEAKDPSVEMRRFRAALDAVRALPEVDPKRVASVGYCFGGTVSLDAAWAGTDLCAVVSFHGTLTTPTAEQAKSVTASILVCHGADDQFVPKESADAFVSSMRENHYDWEFASYGNAVHSFTDPGADGTFHESVKFNPLAASRSWELMKDFLAERL